MGKRRGALEWVHPGTQLLTPPITGCHPRCTLRRRSTAAPTCPDVHLYASRLYTSSSPKCTCSNSSSSSISGIHVSSILDMLISFLLSLKWRSALERANIKWIKTKWNSIMCAWLLLFIDNENNYCAWNSVRIIEGLDNRGSENRGSTVLLWF